MLVVGLLIYLLIGTIVFYKSTKAWNDDGYKWTKQWFILMLIITVTLWPLCTIVGIKLMIKYGADEADRITTKDGEDLNMVEKIES